MVLQDNIRVAAGGCVGSLALIVPEPELESIINDQLIGMTCLQVQLAQDIRVSSLPQSQSPR